MTGMTERRVRPRRLIGVAVALLIGLSLHPAQAATARHALPAKPAAAQAAATQPAPKAVPVPNVQAGPLAPPPPAELVVAVQAMAPFAVKSLTGQWDGLGITLWRDIARDLGLRYRFVEADGTAALAGIADGRIDLAIGDFGPTPQLGEAVAITRPFYASGLAIAVPTENAGFPGWLTAMRCFLSWQVASVVAALLVLLAIAGALIWLFERRRNPRFASPWPHGIGRGAWWSVAGVGRGGAAPATLGGRIVGLAWRGTAVLVLVAVTAAVSAALTTGASQSGVRGIDDLHRARIGVARDTRAAEALQHQGFVARGYDDVARGLGAVATGGIDAFVADAPALLYAVRQDFTRSIRVLPDRFVRQDYRFALRQSSPWREKVAVDLDLRVRSAAWRAQVTKTLGAEEAERTLP